MGLQVTNGTDQWTEGTSQTQDKVVLPSGTASSTHLSLEERAVEHNRVDPQGHTTAHKLPVETSEHSDSKNQHLKGDEQSQKVAQGTGFLNKTGPPGKCLGVEVSFFS